MIQISNSVRTPLQLPAVTALIDGNALRHNLRKVRQLAPSSRIMAMVKANAYGHGIVTVAHALSEADSFGVARLDEALQLRAAGIVKPIVLFNGFFSSTDLTVMTRHNIEAVVYSVEQLIALERTKLITPLTIWLKVDTGLHRLGIDWQQAESVYQRLCHCRNVQQPIGFLSHFSHSGESARNKTQTQIERFDTVVAGKLGPQSLAASSSILLWPSAHRDWVRPGIMLYGISPLSATAVGGAIDLQPVMILKAQLIAVREHPAGASVGYEGTWRSPRATRIGVVSIGYGDGYPQGAPYGTPLLVNGRKVPLVGRVSMDLLSVDLGAEAADSVGDEVVVWGQGLPAEEVAQTIGINPYELVARVTARVPRECLSMRCVSTTQQ